MPSSKKVLYMDTCVWGMISRSEAAKSGLISFCNEHKPALAISSFTLFELSRAPQILAGIDDLLFELRHHIYIASIYDDVIESELESFPAVWRMRWLPLFFINDFTGPDFVNRLVSDPEFVEVRDDFRGFGLTDYKSLVDLKENFPPIHDDVYTIDDAPFFAFGTSVEYLGRHFPQFLKTIIDDLGEQGHTGLDSILSLRIRSLFLFVKYYLHDKLPNDSDFLDFAQVSYAPYSDFFITERDVSNVLRQIESNGLMLQDTEVVFVSDFVQMMEQRDFGLFV
jgi:hypothetical protein